MPSCLSPLSFGKAARKGQQLLHAELHKYKVLFIMSFIPYLPGAKCTLVFGVKGTEGHSLLARNFPSWQVSDVYILSFCYQASGYATCWLVKLAVPWQMSRQAANY